MIHVTPYLKVEDIDKAMEKLLSVTKGYEKGSKISLAYSHHYKILKDFKEKSNTNVEKQ